LYAFTTICNASIVLVLSDLLELYYGKAIVCPSFEVKSCTLPGSPQGMLST